MGPRGRLVSGIRPTRVCLGLSMLVFASPRLHACAATALVMLVSAACSLPGSSTNFGGDPCLLQIYQTRGFSIIHTIQSDLNTVTSRVDALAPSGAINAGQDVTETLTSLAEFHLALTSQQNLLRMGAQPPEGSAFHAAIEATVQRFETGAHMLVQAYIDALNGDTITADAIAMGARNWMREGRVMLGEAETAIAALATFSPNC